MFVIETARRLSRTGADVLKMEFPYDIQFNHGSGGMACGLYPTKRCLRRALGAAERGGRF